MPTLNFLNRNNKNSNSHGGISPKEDGVDIKSSGAAMASSTNAPLLHLPAEECRKLLREYVFTAADKVYQRIGEDASMDLEEDADLSKEAKMKKKEDQYKAHTAHKERLKATIGREALHPVVSTCLVLDDAKTESAAIQPSNLSIDQLSEHDAFGCVALLLLNYVLWTASDGSSSSGYDARARNVLKVACIQWLTQVMERQDKHGELWNRLQEQRKPRPKVKMENVEGEEEHLEEKLDDLFEENQTETEDGESKIDKVDEVQVEKEQENAAIYSNLYRQFATRKFQALEQAVADIIMNQMVDSASSPDAAKAKGEDGDADDDGKGGRFSRKSMVRAAKIGGVGLAAGTLFAVTGGLAAPGIAAGLAALGVGGTALTLAASPAALVALFGVGGGGLSAYKMKRRTDGLSEFIIHQESLNGKESTTDEDAGDQKAHLHTTVCVSGWLTDECDFQRPWGVSPNNLTRLERLQRFFTVMDPGKVKEAEEFMKPYSNKETDEEKNEELWNAFTTALKAQYGKSPDDLLPLTERVAVLSQEERSTLEEIFSVMQQKNTPTGKNAQANPTGSSSMTGEAIPVLPDQTTSDVSLRRLSSKDEAPSTIRVWDQQTEYGGDIYTIQWESTMLLKMCKVADNLVKELTNKATMEVLKKTVLATLMAAVAMPALLMSLAGSLDNDWALITIRSDLVGKELARSLLQSNEKRPVNLVGYSFGARAIYACLIELAYHQAIWKERQASKGKKKLGKNEIEYTREPASIVQDVILMGVPQFVSRSKLRLARHMVAGRFVNCYSKKDWIILLMFQYQNSSGIMRGTLGTGPVKGVSNVENFDVSSIVSSWHANYCRRVPEILDMVGFDQPMAATN